MRNPKLAGIFYRLDYIEAFGTGIRKIKKEYESYEVRPDIKILDAAFILNLPNVKNKISDVPSVGDRSCPDQKEHIAGLLARYGSRSRKEIQDELHVSKSRVTQLLRDMLDAGLIERIGSGPASRYRGVKSDIKD